MRLPILTRKHHHEALTFVRSNKDFDRQLSQHIVIQYKTEKFCLNNVTKSLFELKVLTSKVYILVCLDSHNSLDKSNKRFRWSLKFVPAGSETNLFAFANVQRL